MVRTIECIEREEFVKDIEKVVFDTINMYLDLVWCCVEEYDKEDFMNEFLSLKKKDRKKLVLELSTLHRVIATFGIEIDRNIYNLTAYMRDIQNGDKEL